MEQSERLLSLSLILSLTYRSALMPQLHLLLHRAPKDVQRQLGPAKVCGIVRHDAVIDVLLDPDKVFDVEEAPCL